MAPATAELQPTADTSTISVYNPYTEKLVGQIHRASRATVVRAIERMSTEAPRLARNERSCSGAQSKCGGRAIEGGF